MSQTDQNQSDPVQEQTASGSPPSDSAPVPSEAMAMAIADAGARHDVTDVEATLRMAKLAADRVDQLLRETLGAEGAAAERIMPDQSMAAAPLADAAGVAAGETPAPAPMGGNESSAGTIASEAETARPDEPAGAMGSESASGGESIFGLGIVPPAADAAPEDPTAWQAVEFGKPKADEAGTVAPASTAVDRSVNAKPTATGIVGGVMETGSAGLMKATISQGSATLSAIDQSLSDDIDNLLQGDFESIDAVLDGVFEEHAVLVQGSDDKPAAPPLKKGESLEPGDHAAAQAERDPIAAPAAVADPAPVVAAQPPAGASPAIAVSKAAAPAACASPPSAAAAKASISEPSAESAAASKPPSESLLAKIQRVVAGLLGPLNRMASGRAPKALELLALPMRFVPGNVRVGVNILAVSLLLWTPVVWALAPSMARSAAAKPKLEVHGESAHKKEEASGHGESGGHAAATKKEKKASSSHGAEKKASSKKASGHGEKAAAAEHH